MAGDGKAHIRVINCPENMGGNIGSERGSSLIFFFFYVKARMTTCADALSCTDILSMKSHLPLQSHLTRSEGLAAKMKALSATKDKVHNANIYIWC